MSVETVRLLIPASVVDHWQPKFEDIERHGVTCRSDSTYAKVLEATKVGKRAYIQATSVDLAEIREECAAQLDDETEVATSNDLDYRRFRHGYRKLREAVLSVS